MSHRKPQFLCVLWSHITNIWRFLVKLKPVVSHCIAHTTVPLTSHMAPCFHAAKFTQYHKLNERPWRNTTTKLWNNNTSSHPHLYCSRWIFLCGEKSLQPCIDYRGLNQITVKYPYPLPLLPSALECTAWVFAKLDQEALKLHLSPCWS